MAGSKKPMRWRYIPDPGAGYVDDLDRAVMLAFTHRHCLLLLDEAADHTTGSKTPPGMRRALRQNRHRALSMVNLSARPVDIDPLMLSQADYVYVFDLPHPIDQERVAAYIGTPPKPFGEMVRALPKYHYLRWDGEELIEFPPVPLGGTMDREARFASP